MNITFYDQKGNKSILESASYWKSGSILGILDPAMIKFLPVKKQMIFQDFFVPFLEWQKIRTWDLWLSECHLGHISLWNESLPLPAKRPIAADVDDYEALRRELNAEFFMKIGALLDQMAQKYLRSLPPEATAKYTLEGVLRTLHQEMTSPLLKKRMEKINEMKLALLSDLKNREDPFLHEKELVRERKALEENLAVLEELVGQIGEELPGFSSFYALLSDKVWEKRQAALVLLAKELDLQLVFIGNPLDSVSLSLLSDHLEEDGKQKDAKNPL